MARLKSRTQHVPGSFQVIIPEIGQKKATVGSFDFCVAYVMGVVRGNRFLAEKYGWSTTREWAEHYVEQQNVARCLANPSWHTFLLMESEPAPPPPREIPDGDEGKKKLWGNVVGAGKQLAAGVGVLLDLLGPTARAVDPALSEKRAAICVVCPKNGKGDLLSYFTRQAAEMIRIQLGMKSEMQLATTHDAALGVCQACDCPLKLKVHVDLGYILSKTAPEVKTRLHPDCWILREEKGAA